QLQSTIREHRDGGNAGGVFSRYNIIKIQKVVNKKLRERYAHRQKEIADENHNHHNERMLFHGSHGSSSLVLGTLLHTRLPPRFSLHQRHHSQRLRRAPRLHRRHVRRRDLLCRELFQKQPVRVRHRGRHRLPRPQGPLLLRLSQADVVLQGDAGEVLPAVQRHEDGPRPPRAPLRHRTAQRQRAGVRAVRHLPGRAGTRAHTHTHTHTHTHRNPLKGCSSQAYPEYLITYQIVKPESPAAPAAASEQKS
ncbi:unnamed protein product, partial [Tetraodon nigroviridis]